MKEGDIDATISISKKGGHVIFANCNRAVSTETLTQERADEIAKEFLNNHGYSNMKETYYLKQNGSVQQDSSPADASLHINPLIFHYHVTGSYLQIQGIRPHAVA